LSTVPVGVVAVVTIFLAMVAIVGVLLFMKAQRSIYPSGKSKPYSDGMQPIDVGTLFSNPPAVPQNVPRAEVQAARQPAPVPAPHPVPAAVPQGEWTPACDDALAALVGLKIQKKRRASASPKRRPGVDLSRTTLCRFNDEPKEMITKTLID